MKYWCVFARQTLLNGTSGNGIVFYYDSTEVDFAYRTSFLRLFQRDSKPAWMELGGIRSVKLESDIDKANVVYSRFLFPSTEFALGERLKHE